ncbi:LuxR C-terminal-related transcriptional regulator [Sulfitobacter brevis]|uniref:LuxR C-terminal-related transcriptional regulator n=1 Tax=Sulfitobacter brevis TaxID=74348 RepID=UPI000B816CA8
MHHQPHAVNVTTPNKDIAANQNKSEKTVRNQASILFEKFGVHSRAELIVRVLSNP